MNGGLLYVANSEKRLMHGSASSGTILFGPQSTIRHAQLRDAASVVDEEKFTPAAASNPQVKNQPDSTSRQIQGTKVDIDFVEGEDRY